jgi:hypothetical protein
MHESKLNINVDLSITSSMSASPATTYTGLIPKRSDIAGIPKQVFNFDNFLDHLMGNIKGNTIAVIGTINPGSLCIQYFYAP